LARGAIAGRDSGAGAGQQDVCTANFVGHQMPIPDPHVSTRGARRTKTGSPAIALRNLDHKSIAIHLVINGRERVVRGVGNFGLDARLGGILRVTCSDSRGNFDLLLSEKDWKGQVKPGESLGCDYLVQISSHDAATS